MRGPDIIIPVKALHEGKSRLAGVMTAADRHALCLRLFRATLAMALRVRDARPLVVSADPLVRQTAAAVGVDGLWTPRPGLCAALEDARIAFAESRRPWLVLPCDLVQATPTRLRNWLGQREVSTLVPDLAETGTNLLYLARADRDRFRFAYGPNSRDKHVRAAAAAGITLRIDTPAWARRDLDQPEDLTTLCPQAAGVSSTFCATDGHPRQLPGASLYAAIGERAWLAKGPGSTVPNTWNIRGRFIVRRTGEAI